MWIVATGNPINGFWFYGAFDSMEEANAWAENNLDNLQRDWWVTEMEGAI